MGAPRGNDFFLALLGAGSISTCCAFVLREFSVPGREIVTLVIEVLNEVFDLALPDPVENGHTVVCQALKRQ